LLRFFRCGLAVCLLWPLVFHGPAHAQEDEDSAFEDEFALLEDQDIVLSAAKHKQKTGFSPAAVIVITRREIEASGAVDLMDLLRRYPAVFVYEFDPMYPTAAIRGTYRVMMMLDGREVNLELFVAPFYAMLPVGHLRGQRRLGGDQRRHPRSPQRAAGNGKSYRRRTWRVQDERNSRRGNRTRGPEGFNGV